ncbi:hypothetical protein [Salinicoccus sp. CNSTN-B1]
MNDRLTITFSRSIMEQEIIRTFFMLLKEKTGQDITVYSNDWGMGYDGMPELWCLGGAGRMSAVRRTHRH